MASSRIEKMVDCPHCHLIMTPSSFHKRVDSPHYSNSSLSIFLQRSFPGRSGLGLIFPSRSFFVRSPSDRTSTLYSNALDFTLSIPRNPCLSSKNASTRLYRVGCCRKPSQSSHYLSPSSIPRPLPLAREATIPAMSSLFPINPACSVPAV